ncbi:MAG: hypothetical protein C0594_07435, partial [Marinilabiliales bacterium]
MKKYLIMILLGVFCLGTGQGLLAENLEKKNIPVDSMYILADSLKYVNPELAIQYAEEFLNESLKGDDNQSTIDSYFLLAKIFFNLGNAEMAIENAKLGLYTANIADDDDNKILALNLLANIYGSIGKYHKALKQLFKSVDLSQELGKDKMYARSLNNIGIVYGNLENNERALEYFNKSLTIFHLNSDKQGLAMVLNNVGNVYTGVEDYDEAQYYFKQALHYAKQVGDKVRIAESYHNLGRVYTWNHQYSEAEKCFQKSLEIKREQNNLSDIILAYLAFADLYIEMGNKDLAIAYLEQSHKIAEKEGLVRELRDVYRLYSGFYEKNKEYNKALSYYKLYQSFRDSVFNHENSKMIADLQISHEISQREKENELLRSNVKLQKLKLEKLQNLRNSAIVIIALFFIVILILINRWMIKKKASRKVNEVNDELKQLNENLEKLVDQRTKELKEEVAFRKDAEYKLLIAVEKAEEANRLKDAFLANMSHEIRTPMNGILGFIDLLKEQNLDKETQQEYLQLISNSGNHLLSIINDIIDISKIEADQLKINQEYFSLNELLTEIYNLFASEVKVLNKAITIKKEFALSDNESYIQSDTVRIRQVMSNLINNALKFTNNGEISFGYKIKDQNIEFFVKDTGVGIDLAKQEIIFDRFRQADNSTTREYGGTGLGLSISKGIVDLMGGNLWLNSKPGKGSVFFFSIPYVKAVPFEKEDEKEKLMSSIEGNKILLVEDDLVSKKYFEILIGKYLDGEITPSEQQILETELNKDP